MTRRLKSSLSKGAEMIRPPCMHRKVLTVCGLISLPTPSVFKHYDPVYPSGRTQAELEQIMR